MFKVGQVNFWRPKRALVCGKSFLPILHQLSYAWVSALTLTLITTTVYAQAASSAKNTSMVTVNPAALNKQIELFSIQEKKKTVAINNTKDVWSVDNLKPVLKAICLKGSKLDIRMQLANNYPSAMRNIVNVTLKTDSEVRKLAFPIAMQLEREVWVIKNYVSARTPLRKSDFTLENRNIKDDPSFYLGSESNPSQWMARINLSPGTILDRRQVETKPTIYQNDQIHLLIHLSGGINITVQATALQNGAIGDRIRIRRWITPQHATYYIATVTGQNSAEMDM